MVAFKKKVIGSRGEVATVNYVDEILFSAIFLFLFLLHEYLVIEVGFS